jgi:apolipoprotein N-acyltransferase
MALPGSAGAGATMRRWEPAALAALGAAHTLTFVHTWAWPAQGLALAVLAWRAGLARPGSAAVLGAAFGTGWVAAGVWWLFISMHRYGGLPAWMAAGAVGLLALALSAWLALAMAAFARWRSGSPWRDAWLLAGLWLLAEIGRGVLFTGFPWLASGYAQVDGPLVALAPWVGVYGMGAVLALLAGWLASPALQRDAAGGAAQVAPPALALAVLGALALVPARDFTADAGALGVSLVQTNVAQDEKFAVEHLPRSLAWLGQALRDARGALVVAPETAVPLLPGQLADFDADYWPALRARFERGAQAALLGVPLGDYDVGYTNSVVGLSAATAGREPYRYDKAHLVPFGEFIPRGFRWFTTMMNIPLGDFNRGPLTAASFGFAGQRLAPNICYEDLFGEELARRFADAANAPTVLVNVSNIGWFGDTVADDQHLQISRLRTLELQRPMLRATNTGMTAVVDHRGRVVAQLPPFTRGVLDAQVQGRTGLTPYARWASRFGLWPLVIVGLVTVGLVGPAGARRHRAGGMAP